MTQQEIVDAVNNLSVGYRISWQDIKYDADKAIIKINAYLGAKFPKMSSVLIGSPDSYSFKVHGRMVPIFDDTYMLSIVVPFIASEILARDEEFTTIYNKYVMEVEDGLYNMFTKEFNRIPWEFRQDDSTGVFFAEDTAQRIIQDEHDKHHKYKPTYTFHINYHVNNNKVIMPNFPNDTHAYSYNDEYSLANVTSANDTYIYTAYNYECTTYYYISGWYYDALCTQPALTSDIIKSDIDVYAKWVEESTLDVSSYVDNYGKLYCYPILKLGHMNIQRLVIPQRINGIMLTEINESLFNLYSGLPRLEYISLPNSIISVQTNGSFSKLTNLTKLEFSMNPIAQITFGLNSLNLKGTKLYTTEYNDYAVKLPRNISITFMSLDGSAIPIAISQIPNHTIHSTTKFVDILIDCAYDQKPGSINLVSYDRTSQVYKESNGDIIYRVHYLGDVYNG